MNRKTVFFDLDGTLLGTRDGKPFQIPESALRAIAAIRRNGHLAVVCTGRPEKFVRHFFPNVFDGFVVSNGARVVAGGETVRDWILPEERVRELTKHFAAYGCRYFWVGSEHAWGRGMEDVPEEILGRMRRAYFFPDFIAPSWELGDVAANAMDFIFRSEAEFEAQRGAFTEEGMVLSRHPGSPSADLSLAENDKAAGIRCFLAKTGIAKEDTAAFGDGWNDIAMMEAAGFGVAMGNAADKVKRAADYVTANIFDDGIALGLRHLGLV